MAKVKRKSTKSATSHHDNDNDRWMVGLWLLPIGLAVIAFGLWSHPKAHHPIQVSSAKIGSFFTRTDSMNVGDRISFWSAQLMKDSHLLAPLRSGVEINDSAPLFPRIFDCTTFIETVGALALSSSSEEIVDRLLSIRYKSGEANFANRNHFPELDWIPNNESAGNLRDITVKLARKAGFRAGFAHKDINRVAWMKLQTRGITDKRIKRSVASAAIEAGEGAVAVSLPYVPVDKVHDVLSYIPNGAIVNIVRENRTHYPTIVSHQGFLVWKDGKAYFRHASRDHEIREVRFEDYMRQHVRTMPWKILGINVNTFEG